MGEPPIKGNLASIYGMFIGKSPEVHVLSQKTPKFRCLVHLNNPKYLVGSGGRPSRSGEGWVVGIEGDHRHDGRIENSRKHTHTATINDVGGSVAHNNTPPYFALVYVIKL